VYQRIVVGVNQAETAARAAETALELGAALGAEVHLVCALADGGGAPLSSMVAGAALAGGRPDPNLPGDTDARAHAERYLTRLTKGAAATTRHHVLPGDPAEVILQVADEVDADLVVVGNKGMQGARRVLGSVPNSVSHNAGRSVLIVSTT